MLSAWAHALQMKSRYPGDAAIADDVEGRAYVEQFGMETFERADKTMTANKVSRWDARPRTYAPKG